MRFSKLFIAAFIFLIAFSACKKNNSSVTLQPTFYFINGGVGDSDKTLILFSSSDTITYNAVISSTYFLSSETLVTIAASDQYRDSYNSSVGTSFEAMPADAFSFRDTITHGTSSIFDTITVSIFKHALSPDKEYMLPLQITGTGGYNIDLDLSVIYLHTTNRILSGIYNSNGTKDMYKGDTVNSTSSFSLIKKLVPNQNGTSYLDYADLGSNGWQYIIGFSREDGTFYAVPNTTILNSVQPGSFKVITDTFDSTTKDIHIKSSYKNLSGDDRVVEEFLTLQ